jgi:hypothetical protein
MITTRRHLGRTIRRSLSPELAKQIAKLDRTYRLDGMREGRLENDLAWKLGQLSSKTMPDTASGYDQGRRIQILTARLMGQVSSWEKYYTI